MPSSNSRREHGNNNSRKGGGGDSSREVNISKAMSFILRHGAQREGLKLDENGYARVDELLAWNRLKRLKVTFSELQDVVRSNEKQRFALIRDSTPASTTAMAAVAEDDNDDEDPSHYLIRATQGHSIAIDPSNLLTRLTLDDDDNNNNHLPPRLAVHGTYRTRWPQILASGGLKRMTRTHIHFAPASLFDDEEANGGGGRQEEEKEKEKEEIKVISGARASADVLIYVDLHRSIQEGGYEWWQSANGVLLTEGDQKTGVFTLEYFDRVVLRGGGGGGDGRVLWRREEKDEI